MQQSDAYAYVAIKGPQCYQKVSISKYLRSELFSRYCRLMLSETLELADESRMRRLCTNSERGVYSPACNCAQSGKGHWLSQIE